MAHLKTWLQSRRAKLKRLHTKRRLQVKNISVVSDDCWGGAVYEELGVKCCSPFVGMGFRARQYLDFLIHMREPDALVPLSVSSEERGYPIITTRYADLMGMHYRSDQEFMTRYERRRHLIDWNNLYIKIDLGKPNYTSEDIDRWNAMRLPRSIAFYPDQPRFHRANIHNGVCIPDWIEDGYNNFHRTCYQFHIIAWLNNGDIRFSRLSQMVYYLLYQPRIFAN